MKQGIDRLLHACNKSSTSTFSDAHSINTITRCDVLHVLKCELRYAHTVHSATNGFQTYI